MNQIQEAIDRRYRNTQASPELRCRVLAQAAEDRAPRRWSPRLVAVACCLALLLAIPVCGATMPAVNGLIARLSPDLAALLMPVSGTATSDGLRVELVSAVADEHVLLVQFELEDLDGRDFLGESIYPLWSEVEPHSSGSSHFIVEGDLADGAQPMLWVYTHDGNADRAFALTIEDFGRGSRAFAEGTWSFQITPELLASREIPGSFVIQDKTYGNLRLSPISMTFTGSEYLGISWIDIELATKDGEVHRFGTQHYDPEVDAAQDPGLLTTWDNDSKAFQATVYFARAIGYDEIASLTINGTRVIG